MKRFEFLSRSFRAPAFAAVLGFFINHANAERILYASFETPVVLAGDTDPDGWTEGGGHPGYRGAANESGKNWSTPYGEQGMFTYSNGVGLKDLGYMPTESGVYILKFNMTSSATKAEYRAEILTQEELFGTPQTEVIVASKAGDSDVSKNMSFSDQITWRYDYNPAVHLYPKKLLIKLMQDPLRADWRNTPIWDNVSVDWVPDVDSTGPTVSDITHNIGGLIVAANTLVTYTVTFNEPMNHLTVNTSDFGNAASSAVTIETVTPVSNNTVFLVGARPTNTGQLRLQINAGATLTDALGNAMNTVSAIQDNTTINVDATNPVLMPSDIVDDKNGGPIQANSPVTYTLTFSQDIDSSSVSADDFGNAGTAPFTIGPINETTPTSGVFTVQMTPTGSGTLQFMVNQNVLITGGGTLNTANAIVDDTTLIVDSTAPTLTAILDNLPDLDEFADPDDASADPVTAGTLIVYDVIFSEDMNHTTVTAADFGNAATVGAAPFNIGLVQEGEPGIFRVEVTPTGAGTIQLRVNAGVVLTDVIGNALVTSSAIVDNTTITVTAAPSNPYASWSSGAAFNTDANDDGVDNGMAWLLGAATPSANAIPRLPLSSQSVGNLVLNFTCLKIANRGTAVLKLQYSKDLGSNDPWYEVTVPDTAGTVGIVNFAIPSTNADPTLVNLQATIPASAATPGTKLFARLKATP